MHVLEILEEVNADNGKLYKIEVLKKYKELDINAELKRILLLAYSPNIIFNIKIIPDYRQNSSHYSLEDGINLLKDLANRIYTGNEAIEKVRDYLSNTTEQNAEVIKRTLLKDLRANFSASTINKVFKGLIPVVPYMGAKVYSEKNVRDMFKNDKVIAQIKMDGRYINIIVNNGEVDMISRQGKSSFIPSTKLIEDAKNISKQFGMVGRENIVLNGELMLDGFTNRYEANGIISSIIKIHENESLGKDVSKDKAKLQKKHNISYEEAIDKVYMTVWDYILFEKYQYALPWDEVYVQRLNQLKSNIANSAKNNRIRLIKSKVVDNYEEAMTYFKEVIAVGEEGLILKNARNIWKDGKSLQVKMKVLFTVDLRVTDFIVGNGKFKDTLGALECQSADGKIKITASGFKDDVRDEIWNNKENYINKIVEIQCNGISRDVDMNYSLQHPVFKGFHVDKDVADDLQAIIDNQDMVLGLK